MSVPHIHAFIDESGQDTRGKMFIVSIVFTDDWRSLLTLCEQHESESRKGAYKWSKAEHSRRMKYMRGILQSGELTGILSYALFKDTTKYDDSVLDAIVSSCQTLYPNCAFTVNIDGKTSREVERRIATKLRRSGLIVRKFRSVSRDESSASIRLADSLAGFCRDAIEGGKDQKRLYDWAVERGIIIEVQV